MIEVEVKLPVSEPDMVKAEILKMGFKEAAFIQERDTYFDNAGGGIRANDEALRVRETKDYLTGKIRAQMNFKGRKLDDRTMTRQELETGVENGEVCRKILQAAGFIPAAPEVVKERVMLQKDNVTACLDSVHGLGEFLELEIIAERENQREECLEKISRILRAIGYKMEQTVRTSYLSMLFGKRG